MMQATVDPRVSFFVLPDVDKHGNEVFTFIAKSRFQLGEARSFQGESAPKLNFGDVPSSPRKNSSILEPTDLSPAKAFADLYFVDPRSKSPVPNGSKSWTSSVEVTTDNGSVSKQFLVFGPRLWQKTLLRGWRLSEPASTHEVPLTFEYAFGGCWPDLRTWFPSNPAGRGFQLTDGSVTYRSAPGHQFEEAGEIINRLESSACVDGITAVDRWWMPRLKYIGDIQVEYTNSSLPLFPCSQKYYNCAPSWLQFELDKLPGANVKLSNIGPRPIMEFVLPSSTVWFLAGDVGIAGVADTFAIHLTEEAIDITWRASVAHMSLPKEVICVFENSI